MADPSFFATTRWTLVRDAARGGDTLAVEAMGALVGTYWQPLYRYARRKGKSPADAEDLVQGFLTHVIEARALDRTDATKGRFRAFLLSSFQHWMINEWKRETRAKRGGGETILSFDWQSAETGLHLEPTHDHSPDKLYDREWALALLGKVLADLEAACRNEGGAEQFEILKPCLTADSARIPYTEIAATLNTSEGAARVAVHRLRKRYRHLLTDEISRTLSSPSAVEEEMQSLFAVLAG
ncbi:MAG: sigma-70 family RNA polymerase sigma factor [Akkermansiaceae bacterium]|jgi:RNA polymerase sigma-70 factor (ECF subfamily)|nr:sigma-70 family RNA polymerase sigma factor [Akkermansiaceae bacterium]